MSVCASLVCFTCLLTCLLILPHSLQDVRSAIRKGRRELRSEVVHTKTKKGSYDKKVNGSYKTQKMVESQLGPMMLSGY